MTKYSLEEYVKWQIPFVMNIHVNIVMLARLCGFFLSAACLGATIFFNQSVSVAFYIEVWGTTFAMIYFFYGFSLCGAYKSAVKNNTNFTKTTTLRLAEHIGFITVCAGVTALLFWYCYEAAELNKYGFADPSLGGGDTQSDPTEGDETTPAPAPVDGEEAEAEAEDCANCLLGYDLGPWQETVSLGNHLGIPALVTVEIMILGRIPVQWKCFISLIAAVCGYIAGVYYYTTEMNDNVGPYPGFNFQFGEDGDTTQEQIMVIVGCMVGVGAVQFVLRNFIFGRIVPADKKGSKDGKKKGDSKSESRPKSKGKGARARQYEDYDDYHYEDEYRPYPARGGSKAKGKGKGYGKGKGKGRSQYDGYDSDDSLAYGEIV